MTTRANEFDYKVAVCLCIIINWATFPMLLQTASSSPVVMKTYQDFGLGFKMQYPSSMVIEKGSEVGTSNVTLYSPQASPDNYLSVAITVTPKAQLIKFGLNSNNLNTMARQVSLAFITQDGAEVTNKTKTFIDGAPAYLIQAQGSNLTVRHIQSQGHMIYTSDYIILKQDILYIVGFITFNHNKFLALEQNIIQSFKFV